MKVAALQRHAVFGQCWTSTRRPSVILQHTRTLKHPQFRQKSARPRPDAFKHINTNKFPRVYVKPQAAPAPKPEPDPLRFPPGSHVPERAHRNIVLHPRPAPAPGAAEDIDLDNTRPAPLETISSPVLSDFPGGKVPLKERVSYLYGLGRSYLRFYKTGLKNIWHNYWQFQRIRGRTRPSTEMAAKYGGLPSDIPGQDRVPTITRNEYQLFKRTNHDLMTMIPFSLVFVVFGEFTPLVIVALGSAVVPYTCRIPKQIRNDVEKSLKRERVYDDHMNQLLPTFQDTPDLQNNPAFIWKTEWLEAYKYGLNGISKPIPVIGPLYWKYVLRPRLMSFCDELLCDTILIKREGGFAKRSPRDIYEWADKYSLHALREHVAEVLARPDDGSKEKELWSEDMKKKLLPLVEAEADYILNQDWEHLDTECHWRTTFRSVGSQSPDAVKSGKYRLDRLKAVEKTESVEVKKVEKIEGVDKS